MNEIKTRSVSKDIKVLDKAANITNRANDAFIRTREQAEHAQQPSHDNYVEYAGDKVKESSQTAIYKAGSSVRQQGRNAIQRARNGARQASRFGSKTTKETNKGMVKTAKKSVKTPKTTIKTSRATVKAAAKTAKTTAKTAQRATQAARAAARAAIATAKAVVKAIIAAVKVTIAAVKGLIALIAAGGWVVVVVILVIALVVFILSSPFGIFAGGGADNTPTLTSMIQGLNDELTNKVAQIQKDAGQVDKVKVTFNNDDNSFIDNWPDILAVFAVKENMDPQNPTDIIVMDQQRVSQLKRVFWDMNTVSSSISEITPSPTPEESQSPESSATPAPRRTLTINVRSKYWDDMIAVYHFDDDQVGMLKELMSAKYAAMFMQLVYEATGNPATDWSSIIDVPEGGMPIPLYLQGDFPQTVCYVDGVPKSVATSGCGATSVSMVIAYLTGNTSQTPYTLFKWAYDNGYYDGGGLGHSCLTKLASLYGVKGTWIKNDASLITEALQEGHPVIAHMGPGIFTDGGHYIVLRGITDDGYVLVNDPGNKNRNRYAYKLNTILGQARTTESFMILSYNHDK